MTPQELKNSILQLAIQGKLVEQRPEEGTGAELYREIQREKQRLIAAGKIKKEKPLPEIAEEEKPFEIPESWIAVRLGNICQLLDGEKRNGEKHPYLEARYLRNAIPAQIVDTGKFVSQGTHIILVDGENSGEVFHTPEDGYLGSTFKVLFIPQILCEKYVLYFLQYHRKNLRDNKKGAAIPHLNKDIFFNLVLPLPPLAEQKRIVAKIEELLPFIDRYEQAWSCLETFNKSFPEDMRKSILQLAIQGKLVEQRPEEGTGEELYQRIQAEKQQRVKAGLIKMEKTLSEIVEEEIPFEIPENWKWARLGDLAWFFDAGKSPNCQKKPVKENEWGVITTTAIQLGFFDERQNKVLPETFAAKESMQIKAGDILITRAGPTNRTGVACLVGACKYNLILSDKTLRINMTNQYVDKEYIVMALNSPGIRKGIIALMSGMDKQQVNISQDKYRTLLIPLPPLTEQRRIVARLEELLPLCDKLK